MLNKLLDKLTGTHITLMVLGAAFVPGALYAVPAYQNVSILNANTGYRASVDTMGRLFTRDASAGLPSNPGQQVDIFFNLFTNTCAATYTVPSNKALVVTALTGRNIKSDTSLSSASAFLYSGASCSGSLVSASGSSDTESTVAQSFGSGIYIAAGGSLSLQPGNNSGYLFAHGYLIPASSVPPATSAEAAPAMAPQDSGAIRAKMQRDLQRR